MKKNNFQINNAEFEKICVHSPCLFPDYVTKQNLSEKLYQLSATALSSMDTSMNVVKREQGHFFPQIFLLC